MTEERPTTREGETVPVPDKGGWVDGETGPVYGGPPAAAPEPQAQPDPKATPAKEPAKKAS